MIWDQLTTNAENKQTNKKQDQNPDIKEKKDGREMERSRHSMSRTDGEGTMNGKEPTYKRGGHIYDYIIKSEETDEAW